MKIKYFSGYFYLLLLAISSINSRREEILCREVPFCQRNMSWDDQAPVYQIISSSIKINKNIISGILQNMNKDYIENGEDLQFEIFIIKSGMFRFKIKSKDSTQFQLKEEDTAFDLEKSLKNNNIRISRSDNNLIIYYFSNEDTDKKTKYELLLQFKPFYIEYKNGDKLVFKINSKNLFDMEFRSTSYTSNENDSMTTIKLDFKLQESFLLTGLPERAAKLNLVDTTDSNYYHFYNIDLYKYNDDTYNGLYGFIPFIMSYSYGGEVISGIIWNNPSETFIGIKSELDYKNILFVSEGGIFDFTIFSDKDINHFYKKYHRLIGKTILPPIFSLGYHQSRFSYMSLNEIMQVDDYFDEYNIPYDAIWFDIDHTQEKRYMTWNDNFKGVEDFLLDLEKKGRKAIVIIDPHIKVDKKFHLYHTSSKNNFFIKYENNDYVGKCWCDEASYLDYFNKDVRIFWKDLIKNNNDYLFNADKIHNIHIWNDMNEPSVFEASRNTIPKTAMIKYNNNQYEHRMAHNMYGMFMIQSTYEGLKERYIKNNRRPFILTRSCFLGVHKYAAIWTGDTESTFKNLELSIPMLLSFSVSGQSFVGADVTGYAEDGDVRLHSRWYQLGIFYPFFRGHSEELAYRREIWLYEKKYFNIMKNAIITRYRILRYIYTQFFLHAKYGFPVMRPIYFEYQNELAFDKYCNIEFFFGDSLLVRPVINYDEDNTNKISVYLNEEERWYDFYSYKEIVNKGEIADYNISDEHIGVFLRGGKILPLQMRMRRSSKFMKIDPFTLIVSLDKNNYAKGQIYFDDEYTFNYFNNVYSLFYSIYQNDSLSFEWVFYKYGNIKFSIEKIIVIGKNKKLKNVLVKDEKYKTTKEIEFKQKFINENNNGNTNRRKHY